jgi:hypothetical protein
VKKGMNLIYHQDLMEITVLNLIVVNSTSKQFIAVLVQRGYIEGLKTLTMASVALAPEVR